MAGFRLTDGSDGCPPTQTPPASYESPFRFDSAGRLWITSCFKGFRYFGAARHDVTSPVVIGAANCTPSVAGDIVSGASITAGTYQTVEVVNDTECTLGLLLSLDTGVDMSTYAANLVNVTLANYFNGVYHSSSGASNPGISGSTATIRQRTSVSANPHDVGVETTGTPILTLAPGASGVVSAKLFIYYYSNAPTGSETLNSAYSAVRVYGYVHSS